METIDKKMNAAYALNLCTVSVSQIIDYDDLNVMEQEYDAILNNLNLENMPHDEALLNILKQILDTITFFRIQEGDRRIVDLKYRQKMRDAIWSAVPNFGLVLATANPIPMLISLASQVGIGYMNYRKTKSENNLDYEEQKWKLQRTAMEQLNGLQRELLDTAWRLADNYEFEDELRLSEKQIKHYDSILMDENALRKYDRLDSIKDNFAAYPPFWYYLGNTANEIYRDQTLAISDETRQYYRQRSKEHFARFWESNKYPLLREDQLASSCALEYADLLIEDGADRQCILELLDKAVKYAGNSWDVLQLSAIGYLRIDAKERAIPALRTLVNEKYNSSVNAQLLSGIYISEYNSGNPNAKGKYEALACRVNNKAHMIPWPTGEIDPEEEFYINQRDMLTRRYSQMIRSFRDKYAALFNEIIPIPQEEMERTNADYSDACRQERIDAVEHIMSSQKWRDSFRDDINDIGFGVEYIRLINSMFSSLSTLSVISNMDELVVIAEKLIKEKANKLEKIQKNIVSYEFTLDDYISLQEITSEAFLDELFEGLKGQINDSVNKLNDMWQLSMASSEIVEFCHEESIPLPDSKEEKLLEVTDGAGKQQSYLSARILGDKAEYTSKVMEKKGVMTGVISKKVSKAISGNVNMQLLYPGSEGFNAYFSKCSKQVKGYKNEALAVLDDKAFLFDTDLIFIQNGVLIVERNSLKEICPYDAVEFDPKTKKLMLGSTNYNNNTVDLGMLNNALVELKQISQKR